MTVSFHVLATMPEILKGFAGASLIGKAAEKGIVEVKIHDLRDHAHDKHRTLDDRPFGGGAGMVLMPEPLFEAIEELIDSFPIDDGHRIMVMSPSGTRLTQTEVNSMGQWCTDYPDGNILLVCGRYEGIDQRVIDHFQMEAVSIGDFVIAGGEVAAMVVIEAVSRLVGGVIGNEDSLREESFSDGNLEYPQYTRPAEFRGYSVPDVLLSGNHAEIRKWRESMKRAPERGGESVQESVKKV